MLIRSSTLFSQCNTLAAATKKVLKKLYASSSTMSPPSQSVRSVPSVPTVRRANRLTRGLRSSDIGGVQCVPLICGASMLRCTVRCSVHPAALQLHSTVCTPRTDSGTVGQWDRRSDGRTDGRTGGTVGPAVGGAIDAGWKWCPGGGEGGLEHLVAAVIMTLEQLLCTA